MPRALEPCEPPPYARGGHAQTVLGHLLPWSAPPVRGRRHELPLPDGDRLVLRHEAGTSGLLALLMHGLSGDAQADHVRGCAAALRARGHGVLALNHRGCGEGRGLARGVYHSGRKEDVAAAVALARRLEPGATVVSVGVSLSGNALLLSLADPELAHPDGALAINPPVDLAACARAIGTGISRLYEWRFVRRLRRVVAQRVRDGLEERARLPRGSSLRGFDQHYTAPRGGFEDADDYYRRCSAGPRLGDVAGRACILTSADDPFVPARCVLAAASGTAVDLHVERHGGHVGYLGSGAKRRWLAYAVPRLVEELAG